MTLRSRSSSLCSCAEVSVQMATTIIITRLGPRCTPPPTRPVPRVSAAPPSSLSNVLGGWYRCSRRSFHTRLQGVPTSTAGAVLAACRPWAWGTPGSDPGLPALPGQPVAWLASHGWTFHVYFSPLASNQGTLSRCLSHIWGKMSPLARTAGWYGVAAFL